MFERMKERRRQQEEELARQREVRRQQLLSMSEKELMVEILLKLEQMSGQMDEIDTTIRLWSN